MAEGLARVAELVKAVREAYPTLAYLLDNKEVGPLLLRLADGQYTQDVFTTKLYKTRWWRTTREAQRKWNALVALDPAEAKARRQQAEASVRNLMSTMGVQLPKNAGAGHWGRNALQRVASASLEFGWSQEQLTDYLLSKVTYGEEGTAGKGGIGAMMREVAEMRRTYMTGPSPEWDFKHAKRLLSGELTMEGLQAEFQQISKTRWGDNETLAGIIDRGGTPAEYFEPIRQGIAQELEIAPDAVDLIGDARFTPVVNHADEQSGTIRPMTQTEALKHTRGLDEWGTTQGARDQADTVVNSLLKTFGARR